MERKHLHPQGPEFSRIVAGVWHWTSEEINERMVHTALDEGITTFDHADIYGGYSIEELFGKVLKLNPELRNRMELVTKCGIKLLSAARPAHTLKHYDTSYEHILDSVEKSLQNFGTDYIDLLLIHRPDPLMNGEEIAEAFDELERSGKVLYFGVSNFTDGQFEMLQSFLPMQLVTNQVEISLFKHGLLFNGVLDSLMKQRVSPMAWSPLGSGKFFQEDSAVVKSLAELCEKYKATVGELLYAWLLAHPSGIFPITGTTKPARIKEAARSLSIQLERQDWFDMLKLVRGHDVA
jgi:predicted oxidoreductase